MGIPERKERERLQRRNAILDAAEKLFFSRGFKEATLEDVAEEAELSKATLYLYFESKEDMYLAVHIRAMGRLREMFEGAAASRETGIEKVRAIAGAYYEFSRMYPDYSKAMIHFDKKACLLPEGDRRGEQEAPGGDAPRRDHHAQGEDGPGGERHAAGEHEAVQQQVHAHGQTVLKLVEDALRTGIEDGTVRPELDPALTAVLLWAQCDGVMNLAHGEAEYLEECHGIKPETLMEGLFNLLKSALVPEEGK